MRGCLVADQKAKARILARLRSATFGNFGDCEPVGEGVSEMSVHVGAGYRAYYTRTGSAVYVLLAGGAKATQTEDIAKAKQIKGETMKKKKTYKPFEAAEYLDNDAVIAEYLSAAEDPNPDVLVAALGDVAKARGMAQIAKDSGLGRESPYKALRPAHTHASKRSIQSCSPGREVRGRC